MMPPRCGVSQADNAWDLRARGAHLPTVKGLLLLLRPEASQWPQPEKPGLLALPAGADAPGLRPAIAREVKSHDSAD